MATPIGIFVALSGFAGVVYLILRASGGGGVEPTYGRSVLYNNIKTGEKKKVWTDVLDPGNWDPHVDPEDQQKYIKLVKKKMMGEDTERRDLSPHHEIIRYESHTVVYDGLEKFNRIGTGMIAQLQLQVENYEDLLATKEAEIINLYNNMEKLLDTNITRHGKMRDSIVYQIKGDKKK